MNIRSTAVRALATTAVAGSLVGGASIAAHANSYYLGVGVETCVTKYGSDARVQGTSTPYQARFQVKRNGVVLFQGTSFGVVGAYTGLGWYEFCGKNKLGNPGPIVVDLSIS